MRLSCKRRKEGGNKRGERKVGRSLQSESPSLLPPPSAARRRSSSSFFTFSTLTPRLIYIGSESAFSEVSRWMGQSAANYGARFCVVFSGHMWHGSGAAQEQESAVAFPSTGLPLLQEFTGLLSRCVVRGVIAQLFWGGFEKRGGNNIGWSGFCDGMSRTLWILLFCAF